MKSFIILLMLVFPYQPSREASPMEIIMVPKRVETIERQIFNTLTAHGVDTVMAKILVAQASMESGKFNNNLTKQWCNVFSIMHSNKRETLSLGPYGVAEGRSGYCSYENIDASAIDMILYMKARKMPMNWKSTSAYCRYLKKRRYYTSSEKDYTKAVWSTYKRIWN